MTDRVYARVSQLEKKALKILIDDLNNKRSGKGKRITESSLIKGFVRWILKADLLLETEITSEMRITAKHLSALSGNLNQLSRAYNEGLIVSKINTGTFFNDLYFLIRKVNQDQRKLIAHIEKGAEIELPHILKNADLRSFKESVPEI